MSFSNRFLTGTAICLLMAAPSAFAGTQDAKNLSPAVIPLMLAQADNNQEPAAECPPGTTASADGCVPAQAPSEPPVAPPEQAAPPQEEAPAEPQAEEAPATEQPPEAPAEQPAAPSESQEAPAAEPAPEESAPAEQPAPQEQPSEASPAEQPPSEEPAEQAPPQEQQAPEQEPPVEAPATVPTPDADPRPPRGELPADQQLPPASEPPAAEEAQDALPENAAPILDSQKGAPAAEPQEQQAQPAEPVPLPQSDAEAQTIEVQPEQVQQDIRSVVEEQGQRIDIGRSPEDRARRRSEIFERPADANVVQQFNDNRTIVEINNNVYVRSSDFNRIARQDDNVYYEELRNGRVREVVERRDGSRLITIRNRYGDVVRRVRVLPDGREYVMAYVPEDRFDRMEPFRDPGLDLPPLRLTIPANEYILDARRVRDPQAYYTFLAEPPVEQVERLYSIDEVRYSARIRDKVRRIDLDTIQFEFGAATIAESEIGRLENLANAILEMLEHNPAETFLLEGHTDAVGSDNANLALSDRRAEAVAVALTNVFYIPPENLVTQGYGEQYLKVNTQEPERENRRVAVRRITPLVAPVASR